MPAVREPPDLQDERLASCLKGEYGLPVVQLDPLCLGVDRDTDVYRAVSDDGMHYFVKLRRGAFDAITVTLPSFLRDQGVFQIIAPLTTKTGHLWATMHPFHVILYPFVEGHDGYEASLADHQWVEFGGALRGIHTTGVPPTLRGGIQREAYSGEWRDALVTLLAGVDGSDLADPVVDQLAAFLKARGDEILDLVGRAERLARVLRARSPEFVLCHSDVHAGNILIDPEGALYIVDWDNPILAPKERDLMFVGGGLMGGWRTVQEEERLFYEGYGRTQIDIVGLAYYRYERIVEDIAVFCQRIFSRDEGREDRQQWLRYLASNFLPSGTIEIAHRTEKMLGSA